MPISGECIAKIPEKEAEILEGWGQYVMLREYLRVIGSSITETDEAFQKAMDAYEAKTDVEKFESEAEGAFENALGKNDTSYQYFRSRLGNWQNENDIPGWSNETCSMDARAYACFVNSAAKAYVTSIDAFNTFLSTYDPAKATCGEEVMSDDFYGKVGHSYLPLVVGGVVLALVAGWFVASKG